MQGIVPRIVEAAEDRRGCDVKGSLYCWVGQDYPQRCSSCSLVEPERFHDVYRIPGPVLVLCSHLECLTASWAMNVRFFFCAVRVRVSNHDLCEDYIVLVKLVASVVLVPSTLLSGTVGLSKFCLLS